MTPKYNFACTSLVKYTSRKEKKMKAGFCYLCNSATTHEMSLAFRITEREVMFGRTL